MANLARAWASTKTGLVRQGNEDRCRVGTWRSGSVDEDWSGSLDEKFPWILVADGMGGHSAGEVASETAIDALHELLAATVAQSDLFEIIEEANSRVFEVMQAPAGRPGMGTTIAGFWLNHEQLKIFNVGDSRVYLHRGGRLKRMTVDHTPATSAGRRSHLLTQSLGGTAFRVPLQPHIEELKLSAGDKIILCTDGLTDMVPDPTIEEVLQSNPDHPARALAAAAMHGGGKDNITVVVAAF